MLAGSDGAVVCGFEISYICSDWFDSARLISIMHMFSLNNNLVNVQWLVFQSFGFLQKVAL